MKRVPMNLCVLCLKPFGSGVAKVIASKIATCTSLVENLKKLHHASLEVTVYSLDRFYYNTSINSHSQLPVYSKRTRPKCPVVSTWNNAIYGAIKHVPHT